MAGLEELEVYQEAMGIGESIWALVDHWGFFAKDTVGKQFVRSADSIAANISEGFGRYFYRENKQFVYYSRGSLYETKTWLTKAHHRGLLPDNQFRTLTQSLENLGIKLNNYIHTIGPNRRKGSKH